MNFAYHHSDMKSSLLLFVTFSSIVGAVESLTEKSRSEMDEVWEAWKLKYHKSYDSVAEEKLGYKKWQENALKISLHNMRYDLGLETFKTELNTFADKTFEEFAATYLGNRKQLKTDSDSSPSSVNGNGDSSVGDDLPVTVDWRDKGYVTPVKNQYECGSCWAFSTTGGLEGQHFNATGNLVSLSEQQLVDCDQYCYGCAGGYVEQGYHYLRQHGSISEVNYPYTSKFGFNHTCNETGNTIAATMSRYVSLPKGNEDKLKEATANVGPISVAIDASGLFEFYKSGVYYSKWCDPQLPGPRSACSGLRGVPK
ncbi:procathepsin L-like [Symsagittifera roscoffensis]|uniref:procathepsin L-like n=1 Tax=Symsagittifera roscoffensis TaxID=84072 RepID=UPI00307C5A13